MTDAIEELKKLPPALLRRIFTAWHAPVSNFRELMRRFSDPASVLTQIAALPERQRRIIVLLAFEHGEIDSGTLVSKLHEAVKREDDAFHDIQLLAELGFVYLRRKRGRLNQVEDKVFLFAPFKDIVHRAVLRGGGTASIGSEFDKAVLKKHERAVLALYEAGGTLTAKPADAVFTLPVIAELARAQIISLFLLNDPVMLEAVLSPSVRSEIERRNKRDASRIEFEYNHFGLVNDIESFLYAVESHRIRKLKSGAYDLAAAEKNGMVFVTPGLTGADAAALSLSLALVKENGDCDLFINADMHARWRADGPLEKMERIRALYRERMPELTDIRSVITPDAMVLAALTAELNRRVPRFSAHDVERYVRTLFMLGECEAGGVADTHIDSVRLHSNGTGGKCLVSNSFEAVLMMPAQFDSEFIYLLMSFAVRADRSQVHTYVFTEESVLRGKHVLAGPDPLGRFLDLLKAAHAAGKPLSKNVELSIRRWYDRAPEITVHMHAILLEADSASRLAELAVSARKEGLVLERIAERHARILSADAHPRKITRFLRKEKMIARIAL